MFEKKASTQYPINTLLASRWSGRAYDPDKFLSQEDIVTLVEAARWSPSCFGDEPWRMILCNKAVEKSDWQKAFECLMEGNQGWAKDAPLLIIISFDTQFGHNDNPNRWGSYDTGAAAMSLCVQATEMNLMTHQMGGFDPEKARSTFNIPDRFTPIAMMTVGYQLAKENLPEDMKERELSDRTRKPLGDCFFNGEWGKGIV